jgi:hypothetical protein
MKTILAFLFAVGLVAACTPVMANVCYVTENNVTTYYAFAGTRQDINRCPGNRPVYYIVTLVPKDPATPAPNAANKRGK